MAPGCINCTQPVTWDNGQAQWTHTTGNTTCTDRPRYGAAPASYRRCGAKTTAHGTGPHGNDTRTQCQRPDDGHTDHTGLYSTDYTVAYSAPVRWSTDVETSRP